jgi:putative photosynthetic complex assembly protein
MSEIMIHRAPAERPIFTKKPLMLCAMLVVGSLALTAFARLTGMGVLRMPMAETVEYRDLTFKERGDGGVIVRYSGSGDLLDSLDLGKGGGFIQTVLSAMMMDRARTGTGPEAPYRLSRHSDGRLILQDPATGRRQTLDSFGSVNRDVFARLLTKGG